MGTGRYVHQVSKGAQDAAKAHGIVASAAERKKKKEAEEAAAREMAAMFAPAIKQPKPPPGAVSPSMRRCQKGAWADGAPCPCCHACTAEASRHGSVQHVNGARMT